MDQMLATAYLPAAAALAGSAVGGLTSFLSTWLSQHGQLKAQLWLQDKESRQALYRTFVDDASALYIDGLTRDKPDLSKMIALYALISRMRIISSARVIEEARRVARHIVASYSEPNMTFDDVREMVVEHALDPLRAFSQACREELQGPMVRPNFNPSPVSGASGGDQRRFAVPLSDSRPPPTGAGPEQSH
jgi:hypothetical protein